MKIGNPADKPPPTAPVAPTGPAAARPGSAEIAPKSLPRPAEGGDASAKVDLSATAAALMSGGTSAEFDAEKVARIQQAIADGSFRIDAEAIADKLIANAQEVLNKPSH